jgi:Uncharacterized protein family UPF0029/RWD domain
MDPLEEELLVVDAIFPECVSADSRSLRRLTIYPYPNSGSHSAVSVTLSIPDEYPSAPPLILGHVGVSQAQVEEIIGSSWTPGEVCLYDLVNNLRELFEDKANVVQGSASQQSPRKTKVPSIASSDDESDAPLNFAISEPIVDRKSTFVGRAIEVHSRAEANAALLWLKQRNKKVARATHNIVAWRLVENGVLMQGMGQIYPISLSR